MFEDFLEHNPWSVGEPGPDVFVVSKPWGDAEFDLVISNDSLAAVQDTLARIVLPPRFDGLYNSALRRYEFFYSQVSATDPIIGKSFRLLWRGHAIECAYREPSAEANLLSEVCRSHEKESDTDWRGLGRINRLRFLESKIGTAPEMFVEQLKERPPISFFVSLPCDLSDSDTLALAKHINLYMSYFWRTTPKIVVHDLPFEPGLLTPSRRTQVGDLPETINATEIEPYLLDLLLIAQSGNPRLRFIQYYQVLEYAAFYWTEESVRTSVRRILLNPDIQARLEEHVPRIIDALTPTRANDEHKIRRVVETAVDPEFLWREVSHNIEYFSCKTEFDGGFVADPVLAASTTREAFQSTWAPKITDNIRSIRNALVHGRESRVNAVIAPTTANELRLRPWLPVIRRIAEQVAIYSGA